MIKKIVRFVSRTAPMLLLSATSAVGATARTPTIEGQFQIEHNAAELKITPRVVSNQTIELRYKINMYKCGPAGTSNHGNSGHVSLIEHELKNVGSTITFHNFSDADNVSMLLKVYQDKQLLAEFSKDYPGANSCVPKK